MVVYPVYEAGHVCHCFRPNDQGLIRVGTCSQLHQRIIFSYSLEFNALPQRYYLPDILANDSLLLDFFVSHYVIAHPFFEYESEGANWLFLVLFVYLVLIS